MKFYCIADEDTVRGFRLAGVDGQAVASTPEAVAALAQACARPELGVIILSQQLAAGMREKVNAHRLERDRPLLVEIPDASGPLPGRQSLSRLVHSAVGISLDTEKGN